MVEGGVSKSSLLHVLVGILEKSLFSSLPSLGLGGLIFTWGVVPVPWPGACLQAGSVGGVWSVSFPLVPPAHALPGPGVCLGQANALLRGLSTAHHHPPGRSISSVPSCWGAPGKPALARCWLHACFPYVIFLYIHMIFPCTVVVVLFHNEFLVVFLSGGAVPEQRCA